MNIPELLMASVFKAIFLGKGVIFVSDDQFLADNIIYFFKYAMQNLFENDIIAISKIDYKNNQKNYENYIIFEKREVIQDKDKSIDPKKLEIEKSIATWTRLMC
ncbi:unnamed protein product [marine sediment metagenome]|uniref:Uncharacterized protein n=1 Tax=marine sediment metagenome TaxID=412755 RepID=X1A422_9ZZZZ